MKILITGATGFIGRHLVKRLAKENKYSISCLVRTTSNITPLKPYGVEFIYADITDSSSVTRINGNFDVLYHCAALVENENPDTLNHINKVGTHNACDLAYRLGIQRVIYLSSVAVVSGNDNIPLIEDLPYAATNKYGQSKIEAEKIALEYRNKGLSLVILRPPMVYGPDEPHMMGTLLKLLKHRLLPTINNGKNHLHMIYIENLVEAMLFCLSKDEFLSGTFFVADKEILTIKELYNALAQGLDAKPPWNMPLWLTKIVLKMPGIGKRLKFIMKDRIYSTKKIESLGFNPPYNAYQALEESARNFIYQS